MKLRLHQFLSKTGVFSSKAEVKQAIWDGEVSVNGAPQREPRWQVVLLEPIALPYHLHRPRQAGEAGL